MAYDLSGILTGGASARSDSLSGLNTDFEAGIERMLAGAPPDIAHELSIMSAYRSPETQAVLWKNALAKYGSESAARKWVAPPGHSQHGFGRAIDWKYASDRARNWVRSNAGNYGMVFPLSNEPWHMEPAGARAGRPPSGVTINSSPAVASAAPVTPVAGAALATPAAPSTTPAAPGTSIASPLATIAQGIAGKTQQQPSEAGQITPSSIGADVGGNNPAAAQLLASIMDARRNRFGLSLMGQT